MAACTSLPTAPSSAPNERAWVLAGAGELPADAQPTIDAARLLVVNDEMREFARRVTANAGGRADQIRALSHALLDEDGMELRYEAEATLSAAEAFAQRRVNCLSYTLLVIALARDIGIDARFNHVQIPPIWDLRGDQVLLYQHINARIDETVPRENNTGNAHSRALILDVASAEYSPAFPQRVITDDEALAQFYNNIAGESASADPRQALRDQLEALRLAPGLGFLWTNLAQRYLSLGNLGAAEVAARTSLQLDPTDLMAYAAAARVYRRLGDQRRAQELQQQEQALLERNPYHHYWLAQRAFKLSQLSAASEAAHRAIELNPNDHRFYFLQGLILRRLDKPREAQRSLDAALRLSAGDAGQQARYRSKFERLISSQATAGGNALPGSRSTEP
ncbi:MULTISPECIES: transglutaminase-like domain-containing protein [Hydrocarboniphaga]|uniref:transglutaminase-like domain-containing protein n=1 Tax=Hydrocarboniphaga TaxID=243627 RepID=UPI0005904DB3|nr:MULTISPECIES: transglutaminase-like domain-containing protein [Hydrocarboniphaga]MDZ4079591.1 transglutaminase domain-containing protein [Hydrocarboniphaga sp.]